MRRADVFDPSQNPSAPGAPRMLGRMETIAPADEPPMNAPPIGVPGGRAAGAPLDLAALGGHTTDDTTPPGAVAPPSNGPLPPPPPRNPNATGALATLPPSATPRDEFDLGYGYVLRKDYALADQTLRVFLKKYPTDRRAPDAQYWLGEALFQRQLYREAAEIFLNLSRDHGTAAKAPDALLRLGESLGALGEKDAACGTLAEVGRKYPRASLAVKQGVEREKKRVHCG
jgi:tol-pal system protein YbgF